MEQHAEKSLSPTPPARPQVFYVMGAGRSGSTVLGVTLGNCESVFYAGELDAWLSRSGEPQIEGAERTRFWAAVRGRVEGAAELYGKDSERAIERSLSLFRVKEWPVRRRLRAPYRRVAESLYNASAAEASTPFIVDTSHYPLRARELQALAGIDLYLIYLMRDPQRVVGSFARKDVPQYTKSTLTTNVYLWLTNALAILMFLRHARRRRLFVRYEDLIADPARVVGTILATANVSVPPPDFSALRTGIPFQGNRLISSEVIALQAEGPRRARPSLATSLLQLPWTFALSLLRPRTSSSAGAHARAH